VTLSVDGEGAAAEGTLDTLSELLVTDHDEQ